jgi:hypothetical protein
VIADTPAGAATVVRLSGAPLPEPDAGRAWREGRPGLLLVTGGRHADTDAALRGLLAAWPADRTKRVTVDLPVDDVVCVDALEDARIIQLPQASLDFFAFMREEAKHWDGRDPVRKLG